jgi:hypothetical protein
LEACSLIVKNTFENFSLPFMNGGNKKMLPVDTLKQLFTVIPDVDKEFVIQKILKLIKDDLPKVVARKSSYYHPLRSILKVNTFAFDNEVMLKDL